MNPGSGFPSLEQGADSRPFGFAPPRTLQLTMFTDAHVIRGVVTSRTRRLSDLLNEAEHEFIVVSGAVIEEYGQKGLPDRAEFAQVNLNTLLFAVTDSIVEPQPELRLVKSPEDALIIVPPFKVVGRIHVLPDRPMLEALGQLTGRFIPVTDATFWSESLREPKTAASFVAFNHARAQVLASHQAADPWAGIGTIPLPPLR